MSRKKTISKAADSFESGAENATLFSAIQHLFPLNDEKRPSIDASQTEALEYLMDRLSMSEQQACLLSACCFYNAMHPGSSCDLEDFSHLLKLHPMQSLTLSTDLKDLEDKGYLFFKSELTEGWVMEPKAVDALKNNRPFDVSELKIKSNLDFLLEAYKVIKDGSTHDGRNTIVPVLSRMMMRNNHLPVVKALNKMHCSKQEVWALLLFMTTLGVDGDEYVDMRDIEQILSRADARCFFRALAGGKHPFIKEDIIAAFGGDGMAQADRWVITSKGWAELLQNEEDIELVRSQESAGDSLISYQSLPKKDLFFSGKTLSQMTRLYQLLDEEQYNNIRKALKQNGMPTGFCCLFYGSPGTGKTESVQQLAIATGRDIMQVNISTLRDKYVGESEKRLKYVFDRYHAIVQKQPKAPILFFNEADAIFGNRMENTQHSVDKMENALQNIILQEMERLDGILICTTNLTSNLDKAFDRRFLYKVEFERPTNEARQRIWRSMLPNLTDEQALALAERYDFSGGQILNISRKQIINSIFAGNNNLDYDQINTDCQAEILSRDNGRKIGF